MFLEKLEIQGFKSFAEKTVLSFPRVVSEQKRGVTSIVGPNGSGKSNVADAVRWVLGEQSLKTLRGKKSEDVIFNGSLKRSRSGLSEVSLYLNNEDHKVPLDYSQIVITRRLYRSGDSEYLINGQKARLADINLMMAKANFGTKSYAIIGQGMVESILILTQQEKKEFFDEAAGVRQFQLKRDEALNKLRLTEDNLYEAGMLLNEIEPRLRSLTRQVNRLRKREEMEKELEEIRLKYYNFHYQKLSAEHSGAIRAYEELVRKQEKKDEEVKRIQSELNNYDQGASRSSVFNQLQQKYSELLEEKNDLRGRKIRLESQIEMLKSASAPKEVIIPLEKIIHELEQISQEQGGLISRLKKAVDLEAVKEAAKSLEDSHKKVVRLIHDIKNPSGKREEVKIDQKMVKSLEEVEKKISAMENEIAGQQKKMFMFNRQEEDRNKAFFSLQRNLQERQLELNRLVAEVNNLKIDLTRIDTRKENLLHEMREELKDIRLVTESKQKVDRLQEGENLETMHRLKHQLELIGGIDPETEREYEETKRRHDFLAKQSEDLNQSIKSLADAIRELDSRINSQFDQAFNRINEGFQKYFKVLFNGGSAKLVKILPEKKAPPGEIQPDAEKEELPPEEPVDQLKKRKTVAERLSDTGIIGVDIQAHPPGKRLKSVGMLSGGERAMTAIALICAIIANNPSPFVYLDEVDAALDEANSQRFAEIVDELSHKTQFIVITHNRATMLKSKILYGITMGDDGVSKVISIELKEADRIIGGP